MSRKDTIIVALLINAGLLALLFMLAINTGDDSVTDYPEINSTLTESRPAAKDQRQGKAIAMEVVKVPQHEADEVDHFLKELSSEDHSQAILVDEEGYVEFVKENPAPTKVAAQKETQDFGDTQFVEVTVKRGDALEKIARNNGTTVEAIRKANGMASTKLSIGQTLRIPVGNSSATAAAPSTPALKPVSTPAKPQTVAQNSPPKPASKPADDVPAPAETTYYTVKSGDTPWKIAKQYNVKFDDLLKLNGLNEERARNLKPGDKIRVR